MTRLISSAIFVLLAAGVSLGCSCYSPSHAKTFRKAKAVFVGKLVAIDSAESTEARAPYKLTFDVVKDWKGVNENTFAAFTNRPNMCSAFDFHEGREYLVYVFKDSYVTSDCSSSSELASELSTRRIKELDRFWFRFRSRLWLF